MTDKEYQDMQDRLAAQTTATAQTIKCAGCGIELAYEASDNLCGVCRQDKEMCEPKLTLYSCRVIWIAPARDDSFFSILDTSKAGANSTLLTRLTKLGKSTSNIKDVEVAEVEGPFEKGQILMEYV